MFPGVSAGASLLFQCFVLRSFLEFGSPWHSLLRFALLNDSLRWTLLCPNFYATHRGLRELDCLIRSQLSIFPQNRLPLRAILGHTTHLNSLFQQSHRSFCATILIFLLGCPTASVCRNSHTCHHTCIRIQTCNSSTREGARSHTTVLRKYFKGFFTRCSAFQSGKTRSSWSEICKAFFCQFESAPWK